MRTSPSATAAFVLGSLLVFALAGCAGGGPSWTYAPLGPTPGASASAPASPGGSPGGSPAGTVIEIEETANLEIRRDGQKLSELQVQVGQTYTFRVTNTGNLQHNFYLGPADRLAASDHAGLPGVPEFTSGTQEFTWTATEEAQGWQFACTVLGHYQPMHGDLVLEAGG